MYYIIANKTCFVLKLSPEPPPLKQSLHVVNYSSVILHVSLASTLGTQLLCLIVLLQRKKVSPKGLTFVRCASVTTTSLAARSVAMWVYWHTDWLMLEPS